MDWIKKIKKNSASLEFDETYIREYDFDLQRQEPPTPYVAHFHDKKSKHLFFVAAHHEVGTDNETCRMIKNVFATYQPQIVIVEGLHSETGISPSEHKEFAQKEAAEGFSRSGENYYSIHLAVQAGIPFTGGEPSNRKLFSDIKKLGHSTKDAMSMEVLASLEGLKHRYKINANNLDEQVSNYIQRHFEPSADRITVDEFKEWYHKHNNILAQSLLEFDHQRIAPIRGENAHYFNTLSADIELTRQKHLMHQIEEACQKYDRVLVVYGAGHLVGLRPALEKAFAENEQIKTR